MKKLDPFNFFFENNGKGKFHKDANGLLIPIPIKVLIVVPSYEWRERLLHNLSIRNFKGVQVVVAHSSGENILVVTRCNGRFVNKYATDSSSVANILKLIS